MLYLMVLTLLLCNMEINDRILTVTGGASITEDLELDTVYLLSAEVTTKSVGDNRTNNDGTINIHNKAGITGVVVLTKGDKIIHGHAKTSKASRKLRFDIEALAEALGHDKESFYQNYIRMLIEHIDEVYHYLKNL